MKLIFELFKLLSLLLSATTGALLVLLILLVVPISLFAIGLSFYGIYLAFCANFGIGILVLFLDPLPLVFGFLMFFFEKNLAQIFFDWISKL